MNDLPKLPLLESPRPASSSPIREKCCLRYKRKRMACLGCPLRPENVGHEAAASTPEPPPTR
jgi:hypothetical protein